MKKNDFYLYLNALNILLCLYTYATLLVCFVIFSIAENSFIPNCLIFLSILVKIFLLHLLFVTVAKCFPNSELIKVAEELKTNSMHRKYSLLLAFGYDAIIILCFALHDIKEYSFEWAYIPVYEIITLGGICMFYISLFLIWKIQDNRQQK